MHNTGHVLITKHNYCLKERIIQNQHQIGDNTELSEAINERSKILHSVRHIIVLWSQTITANKFCGHSFLTCIPMATTVPSMSGCV